MLNPRIEKALIMFLAATLILGIAVSAYREKRSHVTIAIEHFDPEGFKE